METDQHKQSPAGCVWTYLVKDRKCKAHQSADGCIDTVSRRTHKPHLLLGHSQAAKLHVLVSERTNDATLAIEFAQIRCLDGFKC